MLRISRPLVYTRGVLRKQFQRKCTNQSSAKPPETKGQNLKDPLPGQIPQPTKKSGGVIGKLMMLTLGTAGGVIGYAWYDPDFKKTVEDNVPYSKETFNFIFSKLSQSGDGQGLPEVFPRNPSVGLQKSEVEVESTKPASSLPTQEKTIVEEVPIVEKPKSAKQKKEEEKRKKQEEEKRKKQDEKEQMERIRREKLAEEAADNAALEAILAQCLDESDAVLGIAMEAQNSAADSIKEHSKELKKAMDSTGEVEGTEGQWQVVTVAHTARLEAVQEAEKLAQNARLEMEKLKSAVENGKAHITTKGNKVLREAEEKLSQVQYDLETAVAEVSKAQSESQIMKEYRGLIKKGREQFKKELESVMPDVKIKQGWGGKMSEEDLNSLIAHAHRRIEQLQNQLAEQQALEAQRMEVSVQRQKEEDDKLTAARLEREQVKLMGEFEIEKQTWETKAKIEMEDEILHQLARQTAAHSDHLAKVLAVQKKELEVHFLDKLHEGLIDARMNFTQEIAGHLGRVRGIEAAIEGRAELEKQGRKAQELWLACQTLTNVIQNGKEGAELNDEQLKPLKNEVAAIEDAGYNHPFVSILTRSFREEALEKGVWTEDALQERFQKVRSICRRVTMIDETNNTLPRFLLSYIQSWFVFTQSPLTSKDEIDPEKISVFRILDNASYHMEKGDMEQALKFMNLLRGESRRVASDWIKDTRLHLETKQASDVLLAHAAATGLGSLF